MSSTNYDVALNINYDYAHRHYFTYYSVRAPYYDIKYIDIPWPFEYDHYRAYYSYCVSFDDGDEIKIEPDGYITQPNNDRQWMNNVEDSGIFSKIYFRNLRRSQATFTSSNCEVRVNYTVKAPFSVAFNATGFAANHNPVFRCSTVKQNTYMQYEWSSATVYYKKQSESSYHSIQGTVSGTWSDVTISTSGLTLEDGYVYDVYIRAVADDGTVANTSVGQFNTVDAEAVATCISPSGAFINGDCLFVWSHSTAYGTPQYAYDLQYSLNNGGSWITIRNHEVTSITNTRTTLTEAGVYIWRVRTYNSNDVPGEWGQASFVNNVPATPPINLSVNTKGRPTVSWTAASQSAYQVQFLDDNNIAIYDSGAVYSTEMSHFVNQYFDDTKSYTVRLRIYNALGEISDWVSTGYQQPMVLDVVFTVENKVDGGALITIFPDPDELFTKYFVLRNNKVIGQVDSSYTYVDKYAVGLTNYSVVGVTSEEQSDIKTNGLDVKYRRATIVTLDGQAIEINKRMNEAYSVDTSISTNINKVEFIGDSKPTHYPNALRLKTFSVSFFDDNNYAEALVGNVVFYADNFGNGDFCMVTEYSKSDSFVRDNRGNYGNETQLTLEVTNYEDSIEYPL